MKTPDPDAVMAMLREMAASPDGDPFAAAERGRLWAVAVYAREDDVNWLLLASTLLGFKYGCDAMYQAFLHGRLLPRRDPLTEEESLC